MPDLPILRRAAAGPAIHVLVIGVGRYPHLKGGGKPTTPRTEGMGQLTSSPASARAFATWVLSPDGFRDPKGRPVASVRLLLAEPGSKPFVMANPKLKAEPQPAGVEDVNLAIAGWLTDLDTDPGHLGVFFFSGHGVVSGLNQALLLSDFGVNPGNAFDASIRFEQLYVGMSRAKAREQLYVVDACRSHSEAFADTLGAGGRPFVTPDSTIQHATPRRAPVFNATLLGQEAFGLSNKPSFFTQALLDALRGAGSDNIDSDDETIWTVETNQLGRGIDFLLERAAERTGVAITGSSISQGAKLAIHRLPGPPVVPITAQCDPKGGAVFTWESLRWKLSDPEPFVGHGEHTFKARTIGQPVKTGAVKKAVRPPYGRIVIPVAEGGG